MAGVENIDSTSENVEWLLGEPLDTLQLKINKNGMQKTVPALHIGFMEVREFMCYKLLPIVNDTGQNELMAEEEEWLECMSFLEDDLHWLLKLPHHRFWSQVIYDENLHKCLESYLTLAPRSYDIVNLNLKEELLEVLKKIHKLIFLVFLRMSTFKESKEHHIRPKVFGEMIYDNFIFDVPKLMDLCVLYGFENKPLLIKMIKNIFTTQPKYLNDLHETCSVALAAFNFAEEKLFGNLSEKIGSCRKLEDNTSVGIQDMSLMSFYDLIGYITDSCATIYMFLEIYSPACLIFYKNGIILKIALFYEKTFPHVEKEIHRLKKIYQNERVIECIKSKVRLSKTFLIKLFRNILSYCCIQHILDPQCSEERSSNIAPSEEFLEIFMEIACEKNFLHDYNNIYPFENDLELINQTGAYLDPERLTYVFGSMHDVVAVNTETFSSSYENGARQKTNFKNVKSNENSVKSLQNIANVLQQNEVPYQNGGASEFYPENVPSEIELESSICAVIECLPYLGDGFVKKCLEYYGYNTELVIDSILSNSLPKELDQLDRNLKRISKEVTSIPATCSTSSVLSERRNIYDNDEFDVFTRTDINTENIHIGKKNKTPNSYQNLESEKESEFLKELIKTYGNQESDDENYDERNPKINIYEDEYDDTYDSALVGLKEPMLEDEPEKDEPPEENSNEENTNREPREDDFCINPEISRQKYAERIQAKAAARNKNGRTAVSHANQDNRHYKDKHKAQIGNHNRKKQSDFKRSRGMVSHPSR